jgi:transposase-like protein
VAQRILNGESVTSLHHELQIKRSVLYRWRDAYRKEAVAGSIPASSAKWVGGRARSMAFACRAKSPPRDALVRIQPYPPVAL